MVKDKQVRMRMSLEDMDKLEYLCGVTGLGKSELIRIFISDNYFWCKRMIDRKKLLTQGIKEDKNL